MKKKISIKATIEKKDNLIKINKRVSPDILILKKEFALPINKKIENKPARDLKNKPLIHKHLLLE